MPKPCMMGSGIRDGHGAGRWVALGCRSCDGETGPGEALACLGTQREADGQTGSGWGRGGGGPGGGALGS